MPSTRPPPRPIEPKLPQIRLGKHTPLAPHLRVEPVPWGSHLSVFVNHAMREYFTPEQIKKTLRRCQAVGIIGWQAGTGHCDLYRRFLAPRGARCTSKAIASGDPSSVKTLADAGGIAIAHHGETTDPLFKSGRLDEMQDSLAARARRGPGGPCQRRTCPTGSTPWNRRVGMSTTT